MLETSHSLSPAGINSSLRFGYGKNMASENKKVKGSKIEDTDLDDKPSRPSDRAYDQAEGAPDAAALVG